jgi:hypothetical protein
LRKRSWPEFTEKITQRRREDAEDARRWPVAPRYARHESSKTREYKWHWRSGSHLYSWVLPDSPVRPKAGGPQATSVYLRVSAPPLFELLRNLRNLLSSNFVLYEENA